MDENTAKDKHRAKHGDMLDSYKRGTGKDGSISVYFNLKEMSDEELKKLIQKANGLYKYAIALG